MSPWIGEHRNGFLTLLTGFFLTVSLTLAGRSANAATVQIEVERSRSQETMMGMGAPKQVTEKKVIGQYGLNDLASRKGIEMQEVDPETKSRSRFQGISLSDLVNDATAQLTAEDRAHFDLVVLESYDGRIAYMPKAFLVKYPSIQLALKKDGKDLAAAAPRVVLPATTNAKIQKESVILEPLYLSGLKSVTLTSYNERFGAFSLQRRTDPAAMRGEKMFMQNCAGCHSQSPASPGVALSDRLQNLQTKGHPSVAKVGAIPVKLEKKDLRSLTSYFDAFRTQTAAK